MEMEPDRDPLDAATEEEHPDEYEIYMKHSFATLGRVLFACWWFFLAYMVLTSRKEGIVAHVVSYTFLVLGLLAVIYVFSSVARSKFTVKGATITRHFVFARPKTYYIREITKVCVYRGRGTIGFRVYMGKKKLFELDSTMVNLNLFLETLQRNHVEFKPSII